MHPSPAFRSGQIGEDRALFAALIAEAGFGMVFLSTPDGPRVAHVPLLPLMLPLAVQVPLPLYWLKTMNRRRYSCIPIIQRHHLQC